MPVRSPVLSGYLAGRQVNAQEQGQGLQQLQGILGLEGARREQEMSPFRLNLLRAQIEAAKAQSASSAARMEELNQRLIQGRQQQEAQLDLARYLTPPSQPAGGVPRRSGVFMDEAGALAAMMQAEAEGVPARYDVADPSRVRALSALASPTGAIPEIVRGLRPPRNEAVAAKEQQVQRLMSTGLSRDLAIGIADGRLVVSRDPMSGQAQILDKATGRQIGASGGGLAPPPAPALAAPARPVPAPGAISPAVVGPAATGPSGVLGNIANTVLGAIGLPPSSPRVEEAVQALTNLNVQTITALQEAIPGRPSVFLMERLGKLAVQPASIFQGDERAHTRLKQTRDMLRTEVARIEHDILANPNNFRPDDISKTRMNLSQIKRVLAEYDTIIRSFDRATQPRPPLESFIR